MSDLTSPLGFKAPEGERKPPPLALVLSVTVVAVMVLLGLWLALVDDPFGGEPIAIVKIEDVQSSVDRGDITTVGVKSSKGELLPPIGSPEAEARERAQDPILSVTAPASAPGIKRDAPAEMLLQADPRLEQESAHGPIPRIGDDGTRPMDAYARPVPGIVGAAPKIALVVGGLGLSQAGTQEAIRVLPPEVTLAFAPYGTSLDRWVSSARQQGHELMLQVPMEPFDYPDNDPGPQTLLADAASDRNIDRLHWVLSRITTYVGVMNYMGARFTAQPSAMDPVLGELAARGLMFLDDGSSSRSEAERLAKERTTAFARADLQVDGVATRAEILGRLAQLEHIARTRGLAVGVASALPISVKEIADWAKTLEQRGITLVPISATQIAR